MSIGLNVRFGSDFPQATSDVLVKAAFYIGETWSERRRGINVLGKGYGRTGNPSTYELLQRVEDLVLALKPANARDQWWLGQATTLAGKIGDARWLLAQQVGQRLQNSSLLS